MAVDKNMQLSGKSVLVTGGAGFIGSHLCEALVSIGARVTVVDCAVRRKLRDIDDVAPHIEFHELDIRSPAFGKLISSGRFDAIFHLAGTASVPSSVADPNSDFRINAVATFEMLERLRYVDRTTPLILMSSAAVYGNPTRIPIRETDPTIPISPYGVSKLAIERYGSVYSRLFNLRAASLRPFSVFGPRLRKQVVYDFIRKLISNPNELTILGDGTQRRDLVYVQDLVRAALIVMEKGPMNGEVYNVATGRGYSTRDIALMLSDVMGLSPSILYTGSIRPGDPDEWIASIESISSLGFTPEISFKQGLKLTYEWYVSDR